MRPSTLITGGDAGTCHSSKPPPVVQARLTVNQPGDRYEREADAVADRVVSMRAAAPLPASVGLIAPSLQRKCSACEESDKHNKSLLRKAQAGAGTTVSPGLVSQLAAGQAGGTPLAGGTRSFMERAFSSDFAGVRVHQDATAAAMSRQIGARAFTHGSHIYFNQGQYQPHTSQGAHLLAHELTHTLQQAGPDVQRQVAEPAQPTLRPAGDSVRQSPGGGVAVQHGTLTWQLRFVGDPGSVSSDGVSELTIGQATDVDMSATFTLSGTGLNCPTITFIQIVRPATGGIPDTAHLLFTRDASGFSVDNLSGDTEPYYGAGPQATGPGLGREAGRVDVVGGTAGRGNVATFHDTPVRNALSIPPGQLLVREFELAVTCVETGELFGSIRWGYTKDRSGAITLTGAQTTDVRMSGPFSTVEATRQAFYAGFFQHSLSGFGRGSARLQSSHRSTLAGVVAGTNAPGTIRRIVLVGSNDFSGGPEANAGLSLERANAVKNELVSLGIDPAKIAVEGHGSTARVANTPGQPVAANRRVDMHMDRGQVGSAHATPGSAREASRLRREDPVLVVNELIDLMLELQSTPGTIPRRECDQLLHLSDAIDRWRRLDPGVPDIHADYGETLRRIRFRCEQMIPRPQLHWELPPLEPPSFIDRIRPTF